MFLSDATLSLMGERRRHRPWGLAGGGPGATGEDWLIKPDGRRERLPAKSTIPVSAGDRLLVLTPGRRRVGPTVNLVRLTVRIRRNLRFAATGHNYPHPCEPRWGSAWCVE